MGKEQKGSKHPEALAESLEQLHGYLAGKDIKAEVSQVEIEVNNIALLRRELGLSQKNFAGALGVSIDTIQNWEQGRRKPRGPARALLNIIARYPSLLIDTAIEQSVAMTGESVTSSSGEGGGRHPVDMHVGHRMRQRRWMVGLTQQQLGEMVGVKFQQIQKYETGSSHISAGRMPDIATALDVSVSFFLDGLEGQAADAVDMPRDVLTVKEASELLRSYYAIPESQRGRLFDLARKLSDVA